jgi:uncharacterized protein (DUF2461 family)
MNAHLNWYLVKFVYQTKAINVLHKTEFHEAWRWVRADNDVWAKEKATVLGRMHERECKNLEFIGTAGIYRIDSVEDGAELFSSTELTARCA